MCNDKHCPCCIMHANTKRELTLHQAWLERIAQTLREVGYTLPPRS